MSVTLRNAIITTHVDTSRKHVAGRQETHDTYTRLGYEYSDIEAELMRRIRRVQGLSIARGGELSASK